MDSSDAKAAADDNHDGKKVFGQLYHSTQNLMRIVPNVSPSLVAKTGAMLLKDTIDKQFLPGVLVTYNHALTQTWYVSVAIAAFSIIGVATIDWRVSVKKKPEQAVASSLIRELELGCMRVRYMDRRLAHGTWR